MNKKSAAPIAAVIEIGSNNVKLRVSQLSKGKIQTLDRLEYPIGLGHDVFENGSVSFDSLRELSAALSKFSAALLSYNIEKPRVVSCSALREAKNRALVIDQLKVRNGLDVEVLDDSQEKAYIYGEIMERLELEQAVKGGSSLIAYVGAGSIGIAVFDGQQAVYSQNIPIGPLKLHDALSKLRKGAQDFHCIVDEYMDLLLSRVDISAFRVQNLIVTGSQMGRVARLSGARQEGEMVRLDVKKLISLYDELRSMTAESIGLRYGMTEDKAAVLYTALFVYRGLLRFCPGAKEVVSPIADISQGVMRYMLSPRADAQWAAYLRKNALACAEATARSFGCDLEHSQRIGEFCCIIFDKLKKVHGLDPSKRLILELAATLHSCGSFVCVRQHSRCTFDMIKGMDIFGLSEAQVLQIALVAGSVNPSTEEDPELLLLSDKERLEAMKLEAMFRMANALDKSHREKLRDLKISTDGDRVLFRAKARENTLLERWAFEEASQFFQNVFGLLPELAVKFEAL